MTSSNVYSLAHEGTVLEARFRCVVCQGTGGEGSVKCGRCHGKGHGETYVYEGVPATFYARILEADSVGRMFNSLIRGKYTHAKSDEATPSQTPQA